MMKVKAISNRNVWFTISGTLVTASIILMIMSTVKLGAPFRLGLDFTGGTKLEYRFTEPSQDLNTETVSGILNDLGLKNSQVTVSKGADPLLIVRTRAISDDPALDTLNTKLEESFGAYEISAIDTVSPIVGPELLNSGLLALFMTVLGILLYISSRFQRDFAFCAVVALFHDVIIVSGLFAFLGLYYGLEVDSLFITALLTTFGFSVHDTIVVFDRIRENQKMQTQKFTFADVAEHSINQVVVRSVKTSFTVLLTLAILFFYGGSSTKVFVGALFAGLFVGTYSSIFLASPLLVLLRRKA